MANTQRFDLTITSETRHLEEVADFVARAAHAVGMDEKESYRVQMAVDEAVSNVIEHAYRGRSDGTILIACQRRAHEFIVEIQDFGQPFNAKQVRTPSTHGPLSKRTIGGLGIFFMKKMMDRVEFESNGVKGNHLRMVKRMK